MTADALVCVKHMKSVQKRMTIAIIGVLEQDMQLDTALFRRTAFSFVYVRRKICKKPVRIFFIVRREEKRTG